MKLTVAICTWNRSDLLSKTLQGLVGVRVPDGVEWEVVVVDNNSTDDTQTILRTFTNRLPIKSVFEQEQGHSAARNAAVRNASGEYTIWTDDDVQVEAGWLEAYVSAFIRYPEAAIFGGPVTPWFETAPPKWLREALPASAAVVALALSDFGVDEMRLAPDRMPFGANMAFRTERLRRYPFDTRLGRRGRGLLGHDEVTVMTAMFQDGDTGWWVPAARVRHFIPKERQTVAYLRRYWFASGLSDAILYRSDGRLKVLGVPAWLWKAAIVGEVQYWWHRTFSRPYRWVTNLRSASSSWGRLWGTVKARRGRI